MNSSFWLFSFNFVIFFWINSSLRLMNDTKANVIINLRARKRRSFLDFFVLRSALTAKQICKNSTTCRDRMRDKKNLMIFELENRVRSKRFELNSRTRTADQQRELTDYTEKVRTIDAWKIGSSNPFRSDCRAAR